MKVGVHEVRPKETYAPFSFTHFTHSLHVGSTEESLNWFSGNGSLDGTIEFPVYYIGFSNVVLVLYIEPFGICIPCFNSQKTYEVCSLFFSARFFQSDLELVQYKKPRS